MEQTIDLHSDTQPISSDKEPTSERKTFVVLFAILSGLLVSAIVLPAWLPGLIQSIYGRDVKVFWYISRATAIMSYLVLWFSMVWGLLLTGRITGKKPGPAGVNDLHKFTSIFGLGLGLFHGLLLTADKYLHPQLAQIFIPFSIQNYRPDWVGLGQINIYLWAVLLLSYFIRKWIGQKTWRVMHFLTFVIYALSFFHGIFSGTDTSTTWMTSTYWLTGGSIVFLLFYRVFSNAQRKDETNSREFQQMLEAAKKNK